MLWGLSLPQKNLLLHTLFFYLLKIPLHAPQECGASGKEAMTFP
jgi:hypothetical protein